MQLRLIVGFAVVGALAAGIVSAARERDYRAHSYVIRVPPAYGGKEGLRFARSDRVLRRALALAGVRGSPAWLRRRSKIQLTSRLDFAIGVEASTSTEAMALATAYAKALKRSLIPEPGLGTIGRRARGARRELGPVGWAMLGGAAGLWLGAAVAIVRSGSARAPRRASAPCARATGATPG